MRGATVPSSSAAELQGHCLVRSVVYREVMVTGCYPVGRRAMTMPSGCTELYFVFLWPRGFQIVQANPPFAADGGLLKESFLESSCCFGGARNEICAQVSFSCFEQGLEPLTRVRFAGRNRKSVLAYFLP